jgi:hypothetical protein
VPVLLLNSRSPIFLIRRARKQLELRIGQHHDIQINLGRYGDLMTSVLPNPG